MKRFRRIPGRGKQYKAINCNCLHGRGFKSFFKKTGRKLLNFGRVASKFAFDQGKTILPGVLKQVGPELLSIASNSALSKASKMGAPDGMVNFASRMAQGQSKRLADSRDASKSDMTQTQQLVSDFVSKQSMDILGSMLNRNTSGSGGIYEQETPRVGIQY